MLHNPHILRFTGSPPEPYSLGQNINGQALWPRGVLEPIPRDTEDEKQVAEDIGGRLRGDDRYGIKYRAACSF
jgi:hypothetical protein